MPELLLAVTAMAVATLLTRAIPFLFFMRRKAPSWIGFAQRYLPPVMMCLLVVNALSQLHFGIPPFGLPELSSAAIVALLHLWKRNALVSILSGTAIYMAILRVCQL